MTKRTPVATALVVEDEPQIAQLVQRYLERDGFCVAVACDGPEALELFARMRPEVVVLDLMLCQQRFSIPQKQRMRFPQFQRFKFPHPPCRRRVP